MERVLIGVDETKGISKLHQQLKGDIEDLENRKEQLKDGEDRILKAYNEAILHGKAIITAISPFEVGLSVGFLRPMLELMRDDSRASSMAKEVFDIALRYIEIESVTTNKLLHLCNTSRNLIADVVFLEDISREFGVNKLYPEEGYWVTSII